MEYKLFFYSDTVQSSLLYNGRRNTASKFSFFSPNLNNGMAIRRKYLIVCGNRQMWARSYVGMCVCVSPRLCVVNALVYFWHIYTSKKKKSIHMFLLYMTKESRIIVKNCNYLFLFQDLRTNCRIWKLI